MSEPKSAGKRGCERLVEPENLEERFSTDDVQVTVGERPYVGGTLANARLLPELVSDHVSLT